MSSFKENTNTHSAQLTRLIATVSYWSPNTPPNAHLLVIDDNPVELKILLELLHSNSYRLSVATDALQGYRRATAQKIDLVLLDVSMGAVDGFAACRLLKANIDTADIPVIFVTSRTQPQERLLGLQSGAVDYILKPFEPAEVLARIEIHLALAQRHKAMSRPAPAPTEPTPTWVDHATSRDLTLLRAAQQVVLADLTQVPSLPELAKRLGTYEKRLTRIFQAQTGRTVYKFIREARLHEARRMLIESEMHIEEIAAAIGFSSAANFSTAFHTHFGCTPSVFRRRNMSQDK